MESCRIAMVFTIFIMTILVFTRCGFAESVAEDDVAAIPPTPMESRGVHIGVSSTTLAFIAFVATCFI
ncbi:hypothetical protein RYX36_026906 [Vicia faba]